MSGIAIIQGDMRDVLRGMPENTFHSVVCDPPYGLGFMGKEWDHGVPSALLWQEALRVLKPGGHLLAFGGSRTYHRMTCAIEDAGFEVRDQIMWVYGSGFPKSLDVSKAIDKALGAERELVGFDAAKAAQQTAKQGTRAYGDYVGNAGHITAPATDAARQCQGWGTALKPAHEPICVARKPLIGTVAANVLLYGTGAINVDGCRVPVLDDTYARNCSGDRGHAGTRGTKQEGATSLRSGGGSAASGRWPANLIHDGSDEVLAAFPQELTKSSGGKGSATGLIGNNGIYGAYSGEKKGASAGGLGDVGTPARFFYTAKSSKADRGEGNTHPTVKPIALMQYLCRLVTPPGGTVLDPFMGSGSTGVAAIREGFRFTGIELDPNYHEIAQRRINKECEL